MTRRYALLFLAALAAAVVAGVMARGARDTAPEARPIAAAPVSVTVEILARDVTASTSSIAAGTRVALRVTNSTGVPARLRLAGYEDRVDSGPIDPGGVFAVTFVADRPGDRFAWLVDDDPRGRLDVTGSHLVEGHR
jgi:hypothetical protein